MIRYSMFPGGSIGAGLFVGSGAAFHNGGPGSVVRMSERFISKIIFLTVPAADCFHTGRLYVALHRASAGRARGPVPGQRRFLHLRLSFSR